MLNTLTTDDFAKFRRSQSSPKYSKSLLYSASGRRGCSIQIVCKPMSEPRYKVTWQGEYPEFDSLLEAEKFLYCKMEGIEAW